MSAVIVLAMMGISADQPRAPKRVGTFQHQPIREASGLVRSRQFPHIYWTHNDSGNTPTLFAVRRDGTLVREYTVSAPNVDWEDIATDDKGHLFIADIGNNGNRLPLRAIYRIDEPDPSKPGTSASKITGAIHYKFPPDGRFDAESLVIVGDRALIISKTIDGREAELYDLPLDFNTSLLKPATPTKIGKLTGFTEPATGASVSADGHTLAVCSMKTLGVYDNANGEWRRLALFPFVIDDQIEAVCWEGSDILLAGERRGIYSVRELDWRMAGIPRPDARQNSPKP